MIKVTPGANIAPIGFRPTEVKLDFTDWRSYCMFRAVLNLMANAEDFINDTHDPTVNATAALISYANWVANNHRAWTQQGTEDGAEFTRADLEELKTALARITEVVESNQR